MRSARESRWGARAGRLLLGALLVALAACGRSGGRVALAAAPGPPTVRVLLGGPRDAAGITSEGAWQAAGGSWRDGGPTLSATIAPSTGGIAFRGIATGVSTLRVTARAGFAIEDGRGVRVVYRGDLLVRQEAGRIVLVNELDLETYVAGVIVNEIGQDAPASAFRAQAVAARSFAYVQWKTAPDAPHHLYDSARSQVYRGVTLPSPSAVGAADLDRFARETRGVILTWRSEPFPTYYHSTCGGHTTDTATADLPLGGFFEPLSGVPCRYCGPSKYFDWTETVPFERLLAGLKDRGVGTPIHSVEVTKTGRGGWASEVTVLHGPKKSKKLVPAPAFRTAAGLRSMHVASLTPGEGFVTVTGRGWGHGVGMCQVGCREMARKGLTETEILRYYYPAADFTRIY
jgi:stage II sporulation protein D